VISKILKPDLSLLRDRILQEFLEVLGDNQGFDDLFQGALARVMQLIRLETKLEELAILKSIIRLGLAIDQRIYSDRARAGFPERKRAQRFPQDTTYQSGYTEGYDEGMQGRWDNDNSSKRALGYVDGWAAASRYRRSPQRLQVRRSQFRDLHGRAE